MSDSVNPTELAASLEYHFDEISKLKDSRGKSLTSYGLDGYTLVEVGEFERQEYQSKYPDDWISDKAIVVKDSEGNLYVHFRGTADGNWPYNAVAYGPQNGKITSPVQDWALQYFDKVISDYYEGKLSGKVYVSGHSQGANNAQFVTVRSQYGDFIEKCTSLNGPGFSVESVEESKALYGEAHFEVQRNKIYAFNGEFDYVSCLGQEQIVLDDDDHIKYISYDFEHNGFDMGLFHASEGLFIKDDNGNIVQIGNYQNDYSDFRKLILALNRQITEFPEEQQQDVARLVMILCENMLGAGEVVTVPFSDDDKKLLGHLLGPVLAEGIEENPELIKRVLLEMGLDPAVVELIISMIEEFNELPEEVRKEALEAVISFSLTAIPGILIGNGISVSDFGALLPALPAAIPLIVETALHHPEDVINVIHELGLDEALLNGMKEHPGITIAAVVGFTFALPAITKVIAAITVVDALIHIVECLPDIGSKVKNLVLNLLHAAKEIYQKAKEWFQNYFNAGEKYAHQNPYIKVDPAKLRGYAGRIARVNQRLSNLDSDLRSLYWQVGFLDLWDILMANLITCESFTLNRVKSYLNDAADGFESAENQAVQRMGG